MKQKPLKTSVSQTAQQSSWKFWLWLCMAFLVVIFITLISTAWAVRHILIAPQSRFNENQSKTILSIASFPEKVNAAVIQIEQFISGDPLPHLVSRKDAETLSWVRRFPAPEDKGYLLFSGVDTKAKQNIVKLIRIADGEEIGRWEPDFLYINNHTSEKKWQPKGSSLNLKPTHPILLKNGNIIFNTGSSLVMQSSCSSKPLWVLDEIVHHSNELDENGDSIWAPSVSMDGFPENLWLRSHIRDDALGHFSLDGKLLEKRSFSNILINNGLGALLMGTSGVTLNGDPIHLNQIKAAQSDSAYWKRGDLLISARHLSTLFLYRPSTNKILWHQTGPWMNQHSVDFVDNHRISVFSNNVVSGPISKENAFLSKKDVNRVYIFDFDNNLASQPYEKLLSVARPITMFEGRAQVLSDGGLFIEETNYGRQLRFTHDAMLWSRVNDYDVSRIGLLVWSRYLTADEVKKPLKALAEKSCQTASQER
ncbi:Arylsulfotransferase-like [Methylophilaceae bacterium]